MLPHMAPGCWFGSCDRTTGTQSKEDSQPSDIRAVSIIATIAALIGFAQFGQAATSLARLESSRPAELLGLLRAGDPSELQLAASWLLTGCAASFTSWTVVGSNPVARFER